MNRDKQKKISVKKVILCVVIAMVVAITGLVMYSENVHKRGFIENIKQTIEEMINPLATETSDVTTVDVTGILPGDLDSHECSEYYISEYDETYHWNKCKICGKEYDKVAHNLVDNGWSMGNAGNCSENNVHKFNCNCGYSYTTIEGRDGHVRRPSDPTDLRSKSFQTYTICRYCGKEMSMHRCYKADGTLIGCMNLGVCAGCGYNHKSLTAHTHAVYYNKNDVPNDPCKTLDENLPCGYAWGSEGAISLGHLNYSRLEKISDTEYKFYVSVNVIDGLNYAHTDMWNEPRSGKLTIKNNTSINGNEWIAEVTLTYNGYAEMKESVAVSFYATYQGNPAMIAIYSDFLTPDDKAPVITSVSQDEDEQWEKTKEITITGTENYCSSVKVEILDGENVIYEGTASVTDNNWSITAVPELEADEIGRNLTVRVYSNRRRMGKREEIYI